MLSDTLLMQEKEDLNSAGRIREGSEETLSWVTKREESARSWDEVGRARAEPGILKGITAGP